MYAGAHKVDYVDYHDKVWGTPCVDDRELVEHLILDGAQCGLSWSIILAKKPHYRVAFKDYDVDAIANMTQDEVEILLRPESKIVRNRAKVQGAVTNARLVIDIQKEWGSFAAYLWSFLPNNRPLVNTWRTMKEVPASTELSETMSRDLKRRGFRFVGPTCIYAMLQAAGFVNDHTIDCYRYRELNEMAATMAWPACVDNNGPLKRAREEEDSRLAAQKPAAKKAARKRRATKAAPASAAAAEPQVVATVAITATATGTAASTAAAVVAAEAGSGASTLVAARPRRVRRLPAKITAVPRM